MQHESRTNSFTHMRMHMPFAAGIDDSDRYSFPVSVADKNLQCWTPEHQNLVWPALCALCVYFPSATLTTAIKYSPDEDIRYIFFYNRFELITKGLMLFLSLRYTNEPMVALLCLILGSCAVMAALHFMQPSCQKIAIRWKYFVHCSNVWTCLTCMGALHFQIDHTNWQHHLQAAGAGWAVIFAFWCLLIRRSEQQDVMNAPTEAPATIVRACDEIKQLRHTIAHVTGPGAWGIHAMILRLLDFAKHESITVRTCAFETLAALSYWDHVTSEAFFIEMTPNTSMLLTINAIINEQDQGLRTFAIRLLGAFVRAELHIKELSNFIDEDNGLGLPEILAKFAQSSCRRESQVDCMQTLLAITYIDSNVLDAIAEHCIPMLAEWAQKGSVIEQHLAAELLMLISGRFDLTSDLIAEGALPKLVSLFMSVDDIEVDPDGLKPNTSVGFRSGCLQPESAVVFAHQVPQNVRYGLQRIYSRVEDIYHEADDISYEHKAHRVGRLEWSAWVNSGITLGTEIKRKLTAREFEGVSKVKSAGVTRQHLNELFDLMYQSSDAESSELTKDTLDIQTMATYLSSCGLGDTAEIEKTMMNTSIYQHGIGELDDNDMHEEFPKDLFCSWLLLSLPSIGDDINDAQKLDGESFALRVLHECVPRSRDAKCDVKQLRSDVERLYDEIHRWCASKEKLGAGQLVLHIDDVARYLVESRETDIGTHEQVQSALTREITAGETDVDAHVQLSAAQLQIMKDEITKATVHTLTEIAMAQGAQGRADMVDGGVLVIIARCFKLFKPPDVHGLALNMLHALMNGRFCEEDISHDGDLLGFYSEIREFNAQLERNPKASPLLQFERLTALERRKAHMMAAYLGMYHRSVGTPVNRKVIVSQLPITEDIICKLVRADADDLDPDDEETTAAESQHHIEFANPIDDEAEGNDENNKMFVQVGTFDSDPPGPLPVQRTVSRDSMMASTDEKTMTTALWSTDDENAKQEEDKIFDSSREKIAKTGITAAVRTCWLAFVTLSAFVSKCSLGLDVVQLLKLTDVDEKTGQPGATNPSTHS